MYSKFQQQPHKINNPNHVIRFKQSPYQGIMIRKLSNAELKELVFGKHCEHFEWMCPYEYITSKTLYGWRLSGLSVYTPLPKTINDDVIADVSYLECLVCVPKCEPDIFVPYSGCRLKQLPDAFLKRVMDVDTEDRDTQLQSFYTDCQRLFGYRLAKVAYMHNHSALVCDKNQ